MNDSPFTIVPKAEAESAPPLPPAMGIRVKFKEKKILELKKTNLGQIMRKKSNHLLFRQPLMTTNMHNKGADLVKLPRRKNFGIKLPHHRALLFRAIFYLLHVY